MDVTGADSRAVRRQILRLMGAGLTDEAIAARIGMSARSARRHIAAIMDALGAVSRFQAGAEAARRGWLTGPAADTDPTARPGSCPAQRKEHGAPLTPGSFTPRARAPQPLPSPAATADSTGTAEPRPPDFHAAGIGDNT